MPHDSQVLFIDADDTLWENNIYFERVIARFIADLGHSRLTPKQVRAHLNVVERQGILEYGYGLHSFTRALLTAWQDLSEAEVSEETMDRVRRLARTIAEQPIELLPGIPDTLRHLADRHQLVLYTKGDFAEQSSKLERSGLRPYFSSVEIVAEKTAVQYRQTVVALGAAEAATWMIGNSPRSDINPAIAAGINAVFIPHPNTWVLEHDEIVLEGAHQFLQLERFEHLRRHF